MAILDYPPALRRLVAQLKLLPGLGPRSAERMMLHLMAQSPRISHLMDSLREAAERIEACEDCGFFREQGQSCELCHHPQRQREVLCVVEQAADVLRVERSGAYRGLYHVLGGRLSPLDHVTPEDLRLGTLLGRVRSLGSREVILATGSDVEGEATASYVREMLSAVEGLRVSRLAQGLPAGGGLDHADELTLFQALSGRRQC
jgi:recombination protein RecR